MICVACYRSGGSKVDPRDHATAPIELSEFVVHLKATGVRTYKGEFVTTQGEHIALDLTFERADKPRSGDG